MRWPVVRLKKALYGHPDSGTYWEKYCDGIVQEAGFEPLPPEWPSCYFNKDLKRFLIIYVDDFKMAGKKANFPEAWKRLVDGGLVLDDPTPVGHFLGCRHIRQEIVRDDGSKVTTMEYDFESSLRNSVDRYKTLAAECGVEAKLKQRATPYKAEPVHEHRLPTADGPCVACPWCQTPFAPGEFRQYNSVQELDAERRSAKRKIKEELELLKEKKANPSYGVRRDTSSGDRKVSDDEDEGADWQE